MSKQLENSIIRIPKTSTVDLRVWWFRIWHIQGDHARNRKISQDFWTYNIVDRTLISKISMTKILFLALHSLDHVCNTAHFPYFKTLLVPGFLIKSFDIHHRYRNLVNLKIVGFDFSQFRHTFSRIPENRRFSPFSSL